MINPKLYIGLAKRQFYTAGIQPVYGGYYEYIDRIERKPLPPQWKTLPIVEKHGNHISSLRMRYSARAIQQRALGLGWNLFAITVDFSDKRSVQLISGVRSPASTYINAIRMRAKRKLSFELQMITVLEEKHGRLHAHILAICPDNQINNLKSILKQDAGSQPNSIKIDLSFSRRSLAKPGTVEWDLEELDRESGIGNFPKSRIRYGRRQYYQECHVDSGWLDYAVKAFEERSDLLEQHRRYHCPTDITALARERYQKARTIYLNAIKDAERTF